MTDNLDCGLSKRSFVSFVEWLRADRGSETADRLLDGTCDLIAKTLIAIQPTLAALNKALLPTYCSQPTFELLGFDVMYDDKLKPWLMEVNQSPSLSLDTEVDQLVKTKLISDMLLILGYCNSPSCNPNSNTSNFWRVYPTTKNAKKYQKLFCFPFPQDMFCNNNPFLNSSEVRQLVSILHDDHSV